VYPAVASDWLVVIRMSIRVVTRFRIKVVTAHKVPGSLYVPGI
jgi:hypothetical protein